MERIYITDVSNVEKKIEKKGFVNFHIGLFLISSAACRFEVSFLAVVYTQVFFFSKRYKKWILSQDMLMHKMLTSLPLSNEF